MEIMTERAEVTFTVKEFVSGTPWIAVEQVSGDKPVLPGLLGFDLMPSTSLEQATEIASYLRKHIRGLMITP
jgi:hypothetical protein